MKATEQHFPVALFIMLPKVVLTFESVDKILKCNHSKECSCGAVCCLIFQTDNVRKCPKFMLVCSVETADLSS